MPRVLLVTDSAWVRNDVLASLSSDDVHHEADPRLAVARAAELAPEAVIVDLQVGSMGGMALTRAIHDAAALGEITPAPVILLLDRSADAFLARRAGANAYVVKPFEAQELRNALASVLTPAAG
jgi:DNA-binding response OmpR family regulator